MGVATSATDTLYARKLARNIPLVYVIRMLAAAFALALPTIVKYWELHGMSLAQITLLQALFAVTVLVGQGPTGYFADRFSRRRSMQIGTALNLMGAIAYAMASEFWGFLVAEVFLGVGISFISGADRALLCETLEGLGQEELFARLWGRSTGFAIAWQAVATLVGGLLATWSMRLPYLIIVLLVTAQCVAASFLTEPNRVTSNRRKLVLADVLKAAKLCWETTELRSLIACSAVLGPMIQLGLWFYQPYFELCGLPMVWWGLVFSALNLAACVASWNAHRFTKLLGYRGLFRLIVAALVIGYVLVGSFSPQWGWVFILVHQIIRGLLQTSVGAAISQAAPSEVRATIGSVESMAYTVVYMAFLTPIGWLADQFGLTVMFLSLAAISGVLGVVVVKMVPKEGV